MNRIIINFYERPNSNEPDELIRWFCKVFGLSNDSEPNPISEQILIRFAEAAKNNIGLSSSELDLDTELAKSSVIYHLNRFIEAGLLVKRGRKYHLRASEMQKAIKEIEYDVERELSRMLDTAKDLDRIMSISPKRLKKG